MRLLLDRLSLELELDLAREIVAALVCLAPESRLGWPGWWGWFVDVEHERLGAGELRLVVPQRHARVAYLSWTPSAPPQPGARLIPTRWDDSARWEAGRRRFFSLVRRHAEDRRTVNAYRRVLLRRHDPHLRHLHGVDPLTLWGWVHDLSRLSPAARREHISRVAEADTRAARTRRTRSSDAPRRTVDSSKSAEDLGHDY